MLLGAQNTQDHFLALTYTRVLLPDVSYRLVDPTQVHIAQTARARSSERHPAATSRTCSCTARGLDVLSRREHGQTKDSARTVLRRAQPARRQRVQAGGSCPGGCSAPGTAALPSDCGSGFGRSQRPRECEGAKVAATEVHRSLTGHTCRTEKWSDTGWQGNIARMQGAGLGNSSAVIVPASKPANNAADGRKIEVLMAATPRILLSAQMRMSGRLHFFWSSGVDWRFRTRHVSRAWMADPKRTRPVGAAGRVNEGRTARCEQLQERRPRLHAAWRGEPRGAPMRGTIPFVTYTLITFQPRTSNGQRANANGEEFKSRASTGPSRPASPERASLQVSCLS